MIISYSFPLSLLSPHPTSASQLKVGSAQSPVKKGHLERSLGTWSQEQTSLLMVMLPGPEGNGNPVSTRIRTNSFPSIANEGQLSNQPPGPLSKGLEQSKPCWNTGHGAGRAAQKVWVLGACMLPWPLGHELWSNGAGPGRREINTRGTSYLVHWWRTYSRSFINIYRMKILTWPLRDIGAGPRLR